MRDPRSDHSLAVFDRIPAAPLRGLLRDDGPGLSLGLVELVEDRLLRVAASASEAFGVLVQISTRLIMSRRDLALGRLVDHRWRAA
jgi:hypothetical protein